MPIDMVVCVMVAIVVAALLARKLLATAAPITDADDDERDCW